MQFNSHDVKEKSRISGIVRSGLDQFRLASAEWSLVSGIWILSSNRTCVLNWYPL